MNIVSAHLTYYISTLFAFKGLELFRKNLPYSPESHRCVHIKEVQNHIVVFILNCESNFKNYIDKYFAKLQKDHIFFSPAPVGQSDRYLRDHIFIFMSTFIMSAAVIRKSASIPGYTEARQRVQWPWKYLCRITLNYCYKLQIHGYDFFTGNL